jgi:hypothetical protein
MQVPAVTVKPDRDLQQCAELHYAVSSKAEDGFHGITEFENSCHKEISLIKRV